MKFDKAKCPSCGAPIKFEEGRDDTFCSHCGTQVFKTDDQLEIKLEYEEKKEDREERLLNNMARDSHLNMIVAVIVLIIFAVVMLLNKAL